MGNDHAARMELLALRARAASQAAWHRERAAHANHRYKEALRRLDRLDRDISALKREESA